MNNEKYYNGCGQSVVYHWVWHLGIWSVKSIAFLELIAFKPVYILCVLSGIPDPVTNIKYEVFTNIIYIWWDSMESVDDYGGYIDLNGQPNYFTSSVPELVYQNGNTSFIFFIWFEISARISQRRSPTTAYLLLKRLRKLLLISL